MTDEEFAKSIGANISDDDFAKSIGAVAVAQAPLSDRIVSGVKRNFAALGNTLDTAAFLPSAGIAKLAGIDPTPLFEKMNEREKLRNQWAGDVDPGFAGNLVGALNPLTLPAQIAAMPFQGINTAKQFIDQGESLPRAYGAGAVDTAANLAGIALPGVVQGGKALRAASGAAINVAQDVASRAAIAGIAENPKTKEMFGPSWESAALAAVSGGVLGVALGKKKTEQVIDPDLDTKVDAFFADKTNPSDGYKAGEYAGEVNMDLFRRSQAEAELRSQQEFADLMEAQRVREAELYAAQQFPEQSTVGLSVGEDSPGGKIIQRQPTTDSGLMGLPQRPVEPPVGLSTGEQGVGTGITPPKPVGPSNLMGEPVPGPVGLSTGEGMPGGRIIQRTPETDSGVVGTKAPEPFDPFGSAGATPRRIGKFGQGGAIHPQLDQDIYNMGRSVMRGANGLLKLFYHGARRPIEGPFKKSVWGDLGQGVYVTEDPNAAGKFALNIRGDNAQPEPGGNTHPVYLNLENVFNNESFVGNTGWQQYLKSLIEPIAKRAFEYDKQGWFREGADKLLNDLQNGQAKVEDLFFAKAKNSDGPYTSPWPWNSEVSQSLEKAGFNGIEVKDHRYHQVMVFDPENVKDALNTTNGVNRFGQGGSAPIINDLAQGIVNLGKGIKAHFTGGRVEAPDTIQNPRSPETIKAKQVKTAKAKAIGLKGTVYDSPTTLEEVKANPGPDLGFNIAGKQRSPGQFVGSGAEATTRRNPQNNYAKYIRGLYSKARNQSEFMVHKYVTGPNAYTSMLRAMSVAEKANAYQLVQKLSDIKQNYTPELGKQLGLSTKVQAFMEARQTAFKGQFDTARQVNESLGLKHFEEVAGYSPANFDYAYRTLVYEQVKNKDGTVSNKIVSVINGNSIWERRKGEALYKEKNAQRIAEGKTPYKLEVLDTQGLKKHTSPVHRYDGLATLLSKMAELDPKFAEAKAEVDDVIAGKTKDLFRFNVHELHKKGVEGAIGKKPWKTIEENVDDFFKMEIDHLDTGFRYWSYQDAITKARQSVADLTLDMPNTKKWADDYSKRITGQELNVVGAGLNTLIDGIQAIPGMRGNKNAYEASGAIRGAVNAWLMGFWNPTFMAVQMAQLPANGLTEAFRLRVDLGIPHHEVMLSFGKAFAARTWLTYADLRGKLDKVTAFGEFKDDYIWAKEHGLHTYSEVALSHDAAMNPKLRAAKNVIMHPTTLPEFLTRPTAFMWYADMMRKAGKTGEEAYIQARDATDYTMTNYHPDELPMMYKDLGVSGKNIGSLRAFVHNSGDQFIARMMEADKYPLAATTMVGMTLLLQGITGVMGFAIADNLSMALTDKTLTEWMNTLLDKEHRPLLHGVISAMSELDLQQRFSTADILPGSFAEALAGPQLSKLGKVVVAGLDVAKNPNEASFLQLGKELTPSGLAGYYEDKLLTDDQGFVLKKGERKYDEPRTQQQRDIRRQFGIRPLKERLQDEALYRDSQREFKENDKTKTQLEIMRTSLALGDMDGFNQARKKFLELKGNPASVENVLNTAVVDAKKSERERRRGELTDSWSSLRKQELYKEK